MEPTIEMLEALLRNATHVKIEYPDLASDILSELFGHRRSLRRGGDEAAFGYYYAGLRSGRPEFIQICDLTYSRIEGNSLILPLGGRKLTFYQQRFDLVQIPDGSS